MIRPIGRRGEDTALKNFISLIIAAIGIVAIVYGIVKVTHIFANQEETNAKNTLENIAGRLQALEAGQNSTFLLQGFSNSDKWTVNGWNSTQTGRPDKCYFKSCLCVCPLEGDAAESCQSKGFCKTFDYEGVVVEPMKQAIIAQMPDSYNIITYNLPENVDECRVKVVKSGSSSFAIVQLNPNIETVYLNSGLGMS